MSESRLGVEYCLGKDSFDDGGDFLGNIYTELTCVPDNDLVNLLLSSLVVDEIDEDTVTTVPVVSTVEFGGSLAMFVDSALVLQSYTGVFPARRWRISP